MSRLYLLALAVFIFPLAALAAPEVPEPSSALMGLFVQHVAPVLFSLIGLALTALLGLAAKKWGTEAKQTKVAAAVDRMTHFASVVVADLDATLKPHLKTATADGVLTKAEVAHLRSVALARLKELAGEHGLKELSGLLGIAAPQLDTYLHGLVETAVDALPRKLVVATPAHVPVTDLQTAHGVLSGAAGVGPQP